MPSRRPVLPRPPRGRATLWAEDGMADRALVRAALADLASPARVTFVGTGDEVLTHLAAAEYGLVVLDIDLPGMDGLTVLHRLRSGGAPQDQAIALFTSHVRADLKPADLAACTAFVQKPVDYAAFVAAVGTVLATTTAARPAVPARAPLQLGK